MKYLLPILLLFSLSGQAADLKLESVLSHLSSNDSSEDSELTLDENLHNGKVLKLSNGTLWEVAPQDVQITEIWIFPFPLKLEKSKDKAYPYYLVNKRSKTKVLVRPLSVSEHQAMEATTPTQPNQQQQQQQQEPLQQPPQQQQTPLPPAAPEGNPNQSVPPPPTPTPLDN